MAIFAMVIGLAACGHSSDSPELDIDYSNLKLAPIKDKPLTTVSTDEFSNYLKNGIRLRLGGGGPVNALADASAEGQQQTAFSTTNVHEIGVDEDDRLKYDGEHLYLVEDFYFPYPEAQAQQRIRILDTELEAADADEIGEILNETSEVPFQGIYLHELAAKKQVVSVASSRYYAWDAMLIDPIWNWTSGKTMVRLHDVTDPTLPQTDWTLEIEGNLEGSRKIGNKLYLITHYIPNIEALDQSPASDNERRANEKLILDTPISDLLPHYQANAGGIRTLVSPQECLVADELTPVEGYADIITLTSIDLDSQSIESSICLNANIAGIYSSPDSLYIGASGQVNWGGFSEGTALHKFALADSGVDYRGSGWVDGWLGWNDPAFRMNEHDGYLRVVTTTSSPTGRNHQLTVFKENNNQLEQVAVLPNDEEPAPIGKPGEDIFAVRFMQDRAFIITFFQVDPLYTLDLSNPEQPRIAGELEMPGFSRYLHPLSQDWLLGIGQQVEGNLASGIKLELYDLRNFDQPQIKDTIVIGKRGSWSEALFEIRSISFLTIDDDRRQLSLPITRYDDVDSVFGTDWVDSGLYVFELTGFANNELSLSQQGAMVTESRSEQQTYPLHWGVGRSLLTPEAIYYFQGNQLWSASQSDLSLIIGPH